MQLPSIEKLKLYFKKLPGLGERSSERFAFSLLNWSEEDLGRLGELLRTLKKVISHCDECGALIESTCPFCKDERRDRTKLCVVATPRELIHVEAMRSYNGLYHVLGGHLSPLEDVYPKDLSLDSLKRRVQSLGVEEVILSFDATLEGDATAHFLKEELPTHLKLSRLAFGLPVGSPLDGIDAGTLSKAFQARLNF